MFGGLGLRLRCILPVTRPDFIRSGMMKSLARAFDRFREAARNHSSRRLDGVGEVRPLACPERFSCGTGSSIQSNHHAA